MSEHDHVPILDDLGDIVEGTTKVATTAATATVDAASDTVEGAAKGTAKLIGLHPVKAAATLTKTAVGTVAAPVVIAGKTVVATGDALSKFRF